MSEERKPQDDDLSFDDDLVLDDTNQANAEGTDFREASASPEPGRDDSSEDEADGDDRADAAESDDLFRRR